MDRLVPELLNTVPILDLSALQQPAKLVSSAFCLRLFADIEVELRVVEHVPLANSFLLNAQN